jgi:hypothetical protein
MATPARNGRAATPTSSLFIDNLLSENDRTRDHLEPAAEIRIPRQPPSHLRYPTDANDKALAPGALQAVTPPDWRGRA